MNQETAPNVCGDTQHGIIILAVVTPKHSAEVERILSHTRWQTHVVPSVHEAVRVLRSLPISVVLCEDRLPDGKWLDVVHETAQLCPRPQTVVLSARADSALWGEVLNCGGYDLLMTPLEPREVYAVIPMAWRQCNRIAEKSPRPTAERNSKRELAKVS